jgi:thiol-disulfide isomerase/thioredoxin
MILVRLLLSVFLIGVSLILLINGESYEPIIVELGFKNWVVTAVTLRAIPTIFIFFALFLLVGIKKQWFSSISSIKKVLIYALLVIVSVGLTFIRPIYLEDWTSNPRLSNPPSHDFVSNEDIDLIYQTAYQQEWQGNTLLIPFFTTTCPYCKIAARNMAVNQRLGKLPQTVVVFPGNKEDASRFLQEADLNVDFILLNQDEFIRICGTRFPSIFFVEKDLQYHWIGSEFNNFALQKLVDSVGN